MPKLTKEEFKDVTEAFMERFEQDISNQSCGDLFHSEFPQSVCDKFDSDIDLFDYWKNIIFRIFKVFD